MNVNVTNETKKTHMNSTIANLPAGMLIYLFPCELFISCRTDEITKETQVYFGFFSAKTNTEPFQADTNTRQKDIYRSGPLQNRREAKKLISDILNASLKEGLASTKESGSLSVMIAASGLLPLTSELVNKILGALDLSEEGMVLTYKLEGFLKKKYRVA